MQNGRMFVSCLLATIASLCFMGGVAVLTGGKAR
jgi:hypothetical protein